MEESSMCKHVKLGTTAMAAPSAIVAQPQPHKVAVAAPETPTSNSTATAAAMHTSNGKGLQSKLAAAAAIAAAEPEELLGSVITHNCPGTRASARVIQKMKQDQTRPLTPPPSEREHNKKEEKTAQKTPSQMRSTNKTVWTNLEHNCFFDALNEFGKDFEAVANFINAKIKRRNITSDYSIKTKDQVRQHYYQTYHKICKYVRYSDELKKPVQELYTLINYGEMRRKLQFLSEKHFMKLKLLVYQGQITVRSKGKNIRIKTPSCKALRRLNQLDDSLEDIRLPNKIEVLLSPANMETFGRVQALAQNPRARAIVPLHKKLITFIKIFQYKWRSAVVKLNEEKLALTNDADASGSSNSATTTVDAELCFSPRPGVTIHRPLLSITAYLSSSNICLSAYEERLGVKVRSETLTQERNNSSSNSKRARTESGSEKRSPENKKLKPVSSPAHETKLSLDDLTHIKDEPTVEGAATAAAIAATSRDNVVATITKLESSSGDELNEEVHDFTSNVNSSGGDANETITSASSAGSNNCNTTNNTANNNNNSSNANQTTVAQPTQVSRQRRNDGGGGGNSRGGRGAARNAQNFKPLLSDVVIKRIRKGWTFSNAADITIGDLYVVFGQDSKLELEYYWCETLTTPSAASSTTGLPYNINDCDSVERVKAVATSTVSNKLKHLLLIANLSERVRKRQCNCGHSCERIAAKCKRDLVNRTQQLANGVALNADGEPIFRTPMPPLRRPIVSIDPVQQLSSLTRQKLSRQVLVQRRILAPPLTQEPYDLLEGRNGVFEPIDRANKSNYNSIAINNPNSANITIISNYGNMSSVNTLPSLNDSSSSMATSTATSKDNSTVSSSRSNIMNELDSTGNGNGYTNSGSGNLDMPLLDYYVDAAALPATSTSTLPEGAQDENTTQNFFNGNVSPMHLLRESTSNARWLEENINDFSLTSLLGHLDEIDATRDILDPSSNLSVISESSVDYRHKFQEITALLQKQEKD